MMGKVRYRVVVLLALVVVYFVLGSVRATASCIKKQVG